MGVELLGDAKQLYSDLQHATAFGSNGTGLPCRSSGRI